MNRSVWGVHDYVPSYMGTPLPGIKSGDTMDASMIRWEPGASGPTGCGWYRIIVPLTELAKHGWQTAWRAGTPPADADGYRILVAQRLDKPKVLPLWRDQRLRHRLVYETDDDIFSVPPERWKNATYPQHVMQDVVETAARTSCMVTVTVEPLAEVYRAHGCDNVKVLPNCIPGAVLDIDRPRHHRKVVVGWAGGGSHGPDLEVVADPLRHFLERHKKAELHLAGSDFTREMGCPCRYSEWVPADASLDYYRGIDFDIGLAPLRGTVFDQSKSNIKALEYMALGIPVLASDVTPYRDLVVDGVNGYLIRKPGEWGRRLHELAGDTAAREEMGVKARETARAHTIEASWQRWADAYEELL